MITKFKIFENKDVNDFLEYSNKIMDIINKSNNYNDFLIYVFASFILANRVIKPTFYLRSFYIPNC